MNSSKILLKLVLLGDTGVGKTSLMRHFTSGHFTESYKATIGVDFMTKDMVLYNENGDPIKSTLQIWDTAGQERYKSLGQAFYRGSDICVLVYNVADPKSIDSLDKWYHDFIKKTDSDKSKFTFIIVGNMVDRETRISDEIVYKWMSHKNIPKPCFFKTSAKNGTNVQLMFEKSIEDGYKTYIEKMKNTIFNPPTIILEEGNSWCCYD